MSMLSATARAVKRALLHKTDAQLTTEDATSSQAWGPHGKLLHDVTVATYTSPDALHEVMGVLRGRLMARGDKWRQCYKALLVLEHLLRNGPDTAVSEVVNMSQLISDNARNFVHKDANGRDHGVNVRHRAAALLALLHDHEGLRAARATAKATRGKYLGMQGPTGPSSSAGPRDPPAASPHGGAPSAQHPMHSPDQAAAAAVAATRARIQRLRAEGGLDAHKHEGALDAREHRPAAGPVPTQPPRAPQLAPDKSSVLELLAPDVAPKAPKEEWGAFEASQPPALSMVAAPQLPWAKRPAGGVRVVAVAAHT